EHYRLHRGQYRESAGIIEAPSYVGGASLRHVRVAENGRKGWRLWIVHFVDQHVAVGRGKDPAEEIRAAVSPIGPVIVRGSTLKLVADSRRVTKIGRASCRERV